jgi:HD-like signal output (HDOD) protein/CheY-like chemotaxis protein
MTTSLPTVLFVDDEKSVLDGLRRSLYGQRNEWNQVFATSGAEALEILARERVAVVVSDMRMPGMDGATLLDRVRTIQPEAVRIILSGFSEREAIFRTIGPAHQYFVKPCTPHALAEAIRRSLGVRQIIRSADLMALVGGATSIPALPKALTDLFSALQSQDGSTAEVARIISSDTGLTVNLLKLTNSGFFYLPSSISDVMQAVKLLGFEMVRTLTVLGTVFESFSCTGIDCLAVKQLQKRSLQIGLLARRIAESDRLDPHEIDLIQCAGMLSHVGSLLLFAKCPVQMADLRNTLDRSGGGIVAAERNALGACHAELGAALLGLWGFTDPVVEAVLFHHEPSRCEFFSPHTMGAITAVHAAQHLVKPPPSGKAEKAEWINGLDMVFLQKTGAVSRVEDWIAVAERAREEYET